MSLEEEEEEEEGVLPINHKGGPGVSAGQCQQPVPSLWVGQHPYPQKGPRGGQQVRATSPPRADPLS